MNIPNLLTLLRIVLSIVCIYLIFLNTLTSLVSAFLVFVIASLTDYADGAIARKYDLVTDLGKLLDPIADKFLIIGVFLVFLQIGLLNLWVVIAIILREFIITGLRLIALKRGKVLAAEFHGKHKMISQVGAIVITLIILILFKIIPDNNIVLFLYQYAIDIIMWYVLAITLFSGFYYLWANRKIVKTF